MQLRSKSFAAWAACIVAWICVGCGRDDMGYVTGRVTLDGKPIPEARVSFHPVGGGRMSQDVTAKDGTYEIKYTAEQKGALIGEHNVMIYTGEPAVNEQTGVIYSLPEVFPEKYNKQSTLTANVEPGRNTIDFDLTTR